MVRTLLQSLYVLLVHPAPFLWYRSDVHSLIALSCLVYRVYRSWCYVRPVMADAETCRLCVQIVQSHFGPLAAVILLNFPRKRWLIYDFSECCICITDARKTFAYPAHSLHDDETALSPRSNSGSCAAQCSMAFQQRRGGRDAGV